MLKISLKRASAFFAACTLARTSDFPFLLVFCFALFYSSRQSMKPSINNGCHADNYLNYDNEVAGSAESQHAICLVPRNVSMAGNVTIVSNVCIVSNISTANINKRNK